MTPLSSTIRLILIFFLGLFLLLFYHLGIHSPKRQSQEALQKEIQESEGKIVSLKRELESAKLQLREEEKIEIPANLLNQLPLKDDTAELLSTFSIEGKKMGIEFLLFKPLEEQLTGPVIEMPIEIQLRGTFPQILEFFRYLSQFQRKILISNVEMSRPEKRGKTYLISTSGTMTTFRQSGEGGEK